MVEVNTLSTGASFGELAFINQTTRAATIQCLSNCSLAVLTKEDYQKIIQKIQLREINHKVDFLQDMPFL